MEGGRHHARPRGGDQGAARGARRGRRAAGALRARGQAAGLAEPPQHRGGLRPPGGRRPAFPGHGAGTGGGSGRAPEAPAPVAGADVAPHAAGGAGARGGARERRRPPRSQAGQHPAHRRRQGQGAGLRPGQGVRSGDARSAGRPRAVADAHLGGNRRGDDPGHRRLHEPGAGGRPAGRQALRHLVVRRRALRDAGGRAAVPRRDRVAHAGRRAAGRDRLGQAPRDAAAQRAPPARALPRPRPAAAAARHRRGARGARRRPGGHPGAGRGADSGRARHATPSALAGGRGRRPHRHPEPDPASPAGRAHAARGGPVHHQDRRDQRGATGRRPGRRPVARRPFHRHQRRQRQRRRAAPAGHRRLRVTHDRRRHRRPAARLLTGRTLGGLRDHRGDLQGRPERRPATTGGVVLRLPDERHLVSGRLHLLRCRGRAVEGPERRRRGPAARRPGRGIGPFAPGLCAPRRPRPAGRNGRGRSAARQDPGAGSRQHEGRGPRPAGIRPALPLLGSSHLRRFGQDFRGRVRRKGATSPRHAVPRPGPRHDRDGDHAAGRSWQRHCGLHSVPAGRDPRPDPGGSPGWRAADRLVAAAVCRLQRRAAFPRRAPGRGDPRPGTGVGRRPGLGDADAVE